MEDPIKSGIIAELKRGDRFASELKDALKIKRYPELWTAISELEKDGIVGHYFKETPPSATLAYTLVHKELNRPFWRQ
ncbi:MAG: hypothetical protein HWQ38_24320 [Nostoc sp. NMS7]|uniref:hypothetical protein n=1 Tax=Nostoc sp. NMS7 TaxID=2815391 RepID=UPI0025D6C50C|nr:hypothetical protein [Nostoc sp. NMS7]MBN3949420.1 hypothetical protein [Nostoc sp. NMS7]